MTVRERNVRKDNPGRTPKVFDLVKNDIPIPEYKNLNHEDFLKGIINNKIPVVWLDFESGMSFDSPKDKDLDFTLYWPGKKPIFYPYNEHDPKWPYFIHRLNGIGKQAKKEGYPVQVFSIWPFLDKHEKIRKPERVKLKKNCIWCGETTDIPKFNPNGKYNRAKVFCSDSDCQKNYQNFKYLLRTLVKNKKITKLEQDFRLNPAYSVIDDTWNNSYLMIHELLLVSYTAEELDELQEKEEIPLISDKKFFVTDDEKDVFFENKECLFCGAPITRSNAKFCSDKCRYDYHNEQKKKKKSG